MTRRRTTRSKGRSCTSKTRHPTRAAAVAEAERLIATSGGAPERIDVYACQHCDGYHTGHTPRGKR